MTALYSDTKHTSHKGLHVTTL